jgi:hypothetical protein
MENWKKRALTAEDSFKQLLKTYQDAVLNPELEAIDLLKKSLLFIQWIKDEQGETVDKDNLEQNIIDFLKI